MTREDFYRPAHQAVFDCITVMRRARAPVDPTTVRVELAKAGALMAAMTPLPLNCAVEAKRYGDG